MITPDINLLAPDPEDSRLLKEYLEYVKSFEVKFVSTLPEIVPENPVLFVVASGSSVRICAAFESKYYQVILEEIP